MPPGSSAIPASPNLTEIVSLLSLSFSLSLSLPTHLTHNARELETVKTALCVGDCTWESLFTHILMATLRNSIMKHLILLQYLSSFYIIDPKKLLVDIQIKNSQVASIYFSSTNNAVSCVGVIMIMRRHQQQCSQRLSCHIHMHAHICSSYTTYKHIHTYAHSHICVHARPPAYTHTSYIRTHYLPTCI